MVDNYGKKRWVIPDGYIPELPPNNKPGATGYISHECLCVLNLTEKDAKIKITFFYEDREPDLIEDIVIKARRSKHLRIDRLKKNGVKLIKRGCPYSALIQSDLPIIAQMSRLDTTQENMAFLSSMCYALD